jgi:hypothetical protein
MASGLSLEEMPQLALLVRGEPPLEQQTPCVGYPQSLLEALRL